MMLLAATLIIFSHPKPLSPGHAIARETTPERRLCVDHLAPAHWEVVATAYTAHDEGMDGKGITFSGTLVQQHHTLAVDPKVIPLGSRVYVPYFKDCPNKGWFVSEDTGSAIKGKRIDVFMPLRQDALAFGVRTLQIYVFAPRSARQH